MSKSLKDLALLILFLIVNAIGVAKTNDTIPFNQEAVHTFLRKFGTRSVVIGVIKGDKEFLHAFGKINAIGRKHKAPDGNTLFEIGSITKVFTTYLLADAIQAKKLALHDTVIHFLPRPKNDYHLKLHQITLLQLATHTSGLQSVTMRSIFTPGKVALIFLGVPPFVMSNPYNRYHEGKLMKDIEHVKPRSVPGSKYAYSNLGMMLLGNTLARSSGTSYEDLVKNKICIPLQMNHTYVHLPKTERKFVATGHNISLRTTRWTWRKNMEGAGAITSSTNDMMKFLRMNLSTRDTTMAQNVAYCQGTYYKQDNLPLELGLGWHKRTSEKTNNREVVWHNGGTGGFRSFLGFNKESGVGIVILSNSSVDVSELGFQLLKEMMPPNEEL